MTHDSRRTLREVILQRYEEFLGRLSRRLGSRELAGEVLQHAFVRLEHAELSGELREPASYVLRMAMNIAANMRRRDRRLLSLEEAREALEIPSDDAQDPAAQALFSADLARIRAAMAKLPKRRRVLLTEAWLDETPTAELAARHAIAVRTVQHEIQEAVKELRRELGESNNIKTLRSRRGGVS